MSYGENPLTRDIRYSMIFLILLVISCNFYSLTSWWGVIKGCHWPRCLSAGMIGPGASCWSQASDRGGASSRGLSDIRQEFEMLFSVPNFQGPALFSASQHAYCDHFCAKLGRSSGSMALVLPALCVWKPQWCPWSCVRTHGMKIVDPQGANTAARHQLWMYHSYSDTWAIGFQDISNKHNYCMYLGRYG